MTKLIPEPYLDKNNQKLKSEILLKGISNIAWYENENLSGGAMSYVTPNKVLEITFRDKEPVKNQYDISHELLHALLYAEGFPRIKPEIIECETTIIMLNDLLDHIIMAPRLEVLGYSIQEEEGPAIEGIIENLEEKIKDLTDDHIKRTILNLLYVRSEKMGVRDNKLKILKDFLNVKNLYDKNIIEIIRNNLPDPYCGIETLAALKEKCLDQLGLNNMAKLKYF